MVLRVAVRPQLLTARAVEGQRRGVHEHQRQVGEQVATTLEQPFLHRVLHAARRQTAFRHRLQFLAEPCHRPVEMVQPQPLHPLDGVVRHPFLAGPIRARHEQPVKHAHEHRALDIEPEPATVQKLLHHLAQPQPLPQATEQQRTADAGAGERACLHLRQHQRLRLLRMARQRGDQPVEFAARLQHVLAAERADRALAHPLAFADALHEVEVAVPPGDLFAHEHDRVVHSIGTDIKAIQTR